jgi:hypothetical protein
MAEIGVKVSFRVDALKGSEAIMPLITADGAWYEAFYRYEQRGREWWAVLSRVEEIMPPTPPQLQTRDESVRLHVMHNDGSLDFDGEAARRKREWAEVNATQRPV